MVLKFKIFQAHGQKKYTRIDVLFTVDRIIALGMSFLQGENVIHLKYFHDN